MLAIALLSLLFSFYALYPLRKALKLTEEFSRDILHDLNTPLSSLRLNISRLKVPQSETKNLHRNSRISSYRCTRRSLSANKRLCFCSKRSARLANRPDFETSTLANEQRLKSCQDPNLCNITSSSA